MEGNQEENKTEPITVSSPIPHPSPSSSPKPTSNQNDESSTDPKYEKIQTIKVNEISAIGAENKKLSKANTSSVMNSSLNLFQDQSHQNAFTRRRLTMFSTLGIFQLILSILLSAFGGLLLARNASLSSFGSGIWSGIFSGIAGSLGIMNLKPLLNGFLACSLISVATGTLALALTGIGLVRDYNIYQQDPEIFGAITAALALTFLLVLHLFTSLFSVYYSALTLCSNKHMMDEVNAMNHEKIQNYLRSLSNAGILEADYNGYQPYIKSEKAFSTRSHNNQTIPYNYPQIPIYGPTMGYVTNASNYNHPQSYRSNLYQNHYFIHDEKQSPKEKKSDKNSRKKSVLEDADLSYSGVDRDLADSYLKQIEAKEHHNI